jgi:hypothetical protein
MEVSKNNTRSGGSAMTQGFQHQQPVQNLGFSKSAPTPQHGQPAVKEPIKVKEPRSFQPRPGH